METTTTTNNNKPIQITEMELEVLKKCAARTFNPITASEEEQDLEISLLEKAEAYEAENNLVDERCDYSFDCNLLVWFYHKYCQQEGIDEGAPATKPEGTIVISEKG